MEFSRSDALNRTGEIGSGADRVRAAMLKTDFVPLGLCFGMESCVLLSIGMSWDS